jgi:hypothetical protein
MKRPVLLSVLAASCGLIQLACLAQGNPAPEAPNGPPREDAPRIEKDGREPGPGGRPDQPARLRRTPGQEEAAPRPQAGPGSGPRRDLPPELQAEVRELRTNRAQLMEKLERIPPGAPAEDRAELKQRIAKIDRRMAEMAASREKWAQPGSPRSPREREPARNPVNPELERRLQHLTVAIENLHAAGMHEPAERLAREREEMARQLQNRPGDGPGPDRLAEEVRRLRAELDEVRQALRMLKGRMEELHAPKH